MNAKSMKCWGVGCLGVGILTLAPAWDYVPSCYTNSEGACLEPGSTLPMVAPSGACQGQVVIVTSREPSNGATIRALAPGETGRTLIEAGDACVFCGDWTCEGVAESDIFDVSGRRTNPDSGECSSI